MWKDISNWENKYEVDEHGNVRNKRTRRFLKGDVNSAGYLRVCLYDKGRSQKYFRHRLVAMLFLENPSRLPEVNHIDGDKTNNSVTNLEWCNRCHNEHEARRKGFKSYKPFLVSFGNGEIKKYEFVSSLSNEIGITKRAVQNYLQGKSCGYKSRGIKSIQYLQ